MEIIFKHIWIMCIAATVGNGLILKYRSRKYILDNPELKAGYDNFFKGVLFYGNIPWIIIGIGHLSGLTQDIFEYFTPKEMNPMVLTFHASLIVLWILSVRWIYFKGGAEFIENHPGLFQKSLFTGNNNITANQIKLFFPLMLAGGVFAMIMMWVTDFSTF